MDKPILSIIVPVYNAGKYLNECLNSLVKQTVRGYEIILVDDGSTDTSSFICDDYERNYTNIKALHIKNSGVSIARNTGIDISAGQFITFVDSDDYVDRAFVETLIRGMANTDLLMYSNKIFDDYGNVKNKILRNESLRSKLDVERYIFKLKTELLEEWEYFGFIWNKCYKQDIIKLNNIRFKEKLSCREDNIFNEAYYRNITSMSVLDVPLYNYRVLKTGLTRKKTVQSDFLTISKELDMFSKNITYQPLLLCDKKRIFSFLEDCLFPNNFKNYYREVRTYANNNHFLPMNIFQILSFKTPFVLGSFLCYVIYGIKFIFVKFHSFLFHLKERGISIFTPSNI